jgi:hypothetical protein
VIELKTHLRIECGFGYFDAEFIRKHFFDRILNNLGSFGLSVDQVTFLNGLDHRQDGRD